MLAIKRLNVSDNFTVLPRAAALLLVKEVKPAGKERRAQISTEFKNKSHIILFLRWILMFAVLHTLVLQIVVHYYLIHFGYS